MTISTKSRLNPESHPFCCLNRVFEWLVLWSLVINETWKHRKTHELLKLTTLELCRNFLSQNTSQFLISSLKWSSLYLPSSPASSSSSWSWDHGLGDGSIVDGDTGDSSSPRERSQPWTGPACTQNLQQKKKERERERDIKCQLKISECSNLRGIKIPQAHQSQVISTSKVEKVCQSLNSASITQQTEIQRFNSKDRSGQTFFIASSVLVNTPLRVLPHPTARWLDFIPAGQLVSALREKKRKKLSRVVVWNNRTGNLVTFGETTRIESMNAV